MFRGALKDFDAPRRAAPAVPARPPWNRADTGVTAVPARTARPADRPAPQRARDGGQRIGRLSSIREVVFGAQDALVSTFAVVAGLAAAGVGPLVVLLGGLVSAVAGVLAMSIGTFLASRAQRQLYEHELERSAARSAIIRARRSPS